MDHETVETFLELCDVHRVTIAWVVPPVLLLLVYLRWMKGVMCKCDVNLQDKTALVTGANTGIGKETARDLARRGARVILACRDAERGERAAADIRKSTGNGNVVVYKLDLASLRSVGECAAEVIRKEKRLDILINNAGVMWTPYSKTEDGFELQFATNHLGHFLLTILLIDLMKSSGPSRIVNVSSMAHSFISELDFTNLNSEKSYGANEAYARSKLANVLFTRELARQLKYSGSPVTVYAIHPGAVATDIIRFKEALWWPINMFITVTFHSCGRFLIKSAKEGAQTSLYCALQPEIEHLSGKYFSDCAERKPTRLGEDDAIAAKLWKLSESMVGLEYR